MDNSKSKEKILLMLKKFLFQCMTSFRKIFILEIDHFSKSQQLKKEDNKMEIFIQSQNNKYIHNNNNKGPILLEVTCRKIGIRHQIMFTKLKIEAIISIRLTKL